MDPGFYRFFRHITPSGFKKWIDRYNYDGQEIQDLIQTAPVPLQVQTLDCTAAQSVSLLMNYPARAFVIYFYDSASPIKTIKPNGFVKVRINDDRIENEFPAKHNRGFRGDYYRLFLSWPAQANTKADLVMHMFDDDPWETDSVTATGGAGGTVTSVSVVPANGFSGSVANPATTPAITLLTTVTGALKGNGAAISAIAYKQENPAGAVDGANMTFTLSSLPISGASVILWSNASPMRQLIDYTIAGMVITYAVPPAAGTDVYAYYPS